MATLKDVARLANCDISTVSRALNNSAPVHPETRARIMAAVKELGYEVSPEQVMEINKSGEDISEEELGKIAGGTSCIQILGNQLGMPLTDWP